MVVCRMFWLLYIVDFPSQTNRKQTQCSTALSLCMSPFLWNINATKINQKRITAKHFNVCSLFQSGGYRPGWWPYGGAGQLADGSVLWHLSRVQQIDLWTVFWLWSVVQQVNWCHKDMRCSCSSFNKCRQQSMTFSGLNEGKNQDRKY